ncbi:hypothetical protein BDP27DRAFT_1424020 [Rhodocollybia butyracea]|uniref:Uncharacterized protein n=1 Tax=Rhodocollybia butyracea TaxID=206335 RepID=A0A9P5U4T0_9AGAR|nr:hypothetical protein BDP27DRAFT_1424020 [Rhodocollybia butyracea]
MPRTIDDYAPQNTVSTTVDLPQSASITLVNTLTHDELRRMIYEDPEIKELEAQNEERRNLLFSLADERADQLMDVYKELAGTFDNAMAELQKKHEALVEQKALVDLLRKQLEEKTERCEVLQSEVLRLEKMKEVQEEENNRLNMLLG